MEFPLVMARGFWSHALRLGAGVATGVVVFGAWWHCCG